MKKYISIILITLAVAGSSCKKNYLELTNNPNVPSVTTPDLALSGALKSTADIVNLGDYVQYGAWVGYLSQSTGFQPFTNVEQYNFTTTDFNGPWNDNYSNLANYNALLTSTTEPNYQAIAKIMMAYDYEALVDNYNNVPYSQALLGAQNLNPVYDKGSDIYTDLMKQLDAAIVLIQKAPATALTPSTADIMYGGNMTNWIKFANTLKLRLAVRVSGVAALAPGFAAAAKATQALGYIDKTNAGLVNPGYLNSDADGGQESPLWRYYGFNQSLAPGTGRQTYQANTFATNYYASNNDPRLVQVYAESITAHAATATNFLAGSALNVQNGIAIISTTFGDSQPPTATVNGVAGATVSPSLVGTGLLTGPTMSAVVLSSAESLFLQSEAAARGIITGGAAGAATSYNAGITASFEFDNVPNADAAAATYYAQPAIAYPTTGTLDAQVQAIITQKWASLAIFGAFEAFNENRRTGYPNVPTSIYQGANAPHQVARIFYPFSEYATNAASVAAQGTIDKFNSKIFWAK
jgi:hypothetical protein